MAGGIGSNFSMAITCTVSPGSQYALTPTAQGDLSLVLPIAVALCPSGTEQKGSICSPCDINFFSLDGEGCKPCPEGVQRGGKGNMVVCRRLCMRTGMHGCMCCACMACCCCCCCSRPVILRGELDDAQLRARPWTWQTRG